MDFTSKNIITTAAVTAALLPAASFLMQDSQIAYADSVEYRVVTEIMLILEKDHLLVMHL